MTDVAPRCPFCASVVKINITFWTRIGLRPARGGCPTCQRTFEPRDAHTMGASFYQWAEHFRGQLTAALAGVPILSEPAMERALGNPNKEDTRLIASLEELVRTCLRHHRVPIIERARGREATLEVVPLHNETTGAVEAVAVLGKSSSESGAREWEQIVVRTGMSHFVLFTYPGAGGAEPRVKRAVHSQPAAPKVGTSPKAVADLRHAQNGSPRQAAHR